MELYEAFISSLPAHLRVTMAVRGRYQAYVETEGGAGLASLPLPGKKPYGDAAVCTDWLGKPLRDLAAQLGSDDMSLSALGCAAVNAWFNRRESMEALGVTLYPPEIDEGDVFRTLKPECAGKLVSTIGHFRGGEKLAGMRELRVFEKDPRPGDYPEWEEDRLLPGSDVVVITGMAHAHSHPMLNTLPGDDIQKCFLTIQSSGSHNRHYLSIQRSFRLHPQTNPKEINTGK